jgi:hypothetical protein
LTYRLHVGLINDSTTFTNSSWVNITDAAHVIELDWQAATAAGANNGKVDWWLDGTQQTGVSGIDNDTRRIDRVRLGAVAGVDSTTNGTLYFDAFESRRSTYIGPLGGGLVTTTITFAYDALYRVKDVVYSTGDEFHYQYDAVGNALSYTRTVSGLTVTTTYTYNEANQLLTAQASNDPTVWYYLYRCIGVVTDVLALSIGNFEIGSVIFQTCSIARWRRRFWPGLWKSNRCSLRRFVAYKERRRRNEPNAKPRLVWPGGSAPLARPPTGLKRR